MWFRTKSKQIKASGFTENLIVRLNMQHGEFGDQNDRLVVERLNSRCQELLAETGVICKGDEYAQGEARLLFVCPDAAVAWQAIKGAVLSRFESFPIRVEIEYDLEKQEDLAKTTAVQRRRPVKPLSFPPARS
jgi:hypothetical protein